MGVLVPGKTLVGIHLGPGGQYGGGHDGSSTHDGAIRALNNYEQWWGRPVDFAAYNLPYASWNGSVASWSLGFITQDYVGLKARKGIPMLLAITPFPQGGSYTLMNTTTKYDSGVIALAQNLIASNNADAIIRIGIELDGSWFYWAMNAGIADNTPANFKAAFAKIVTLMRGVAGANFTFEYNCATFNNWDPNVTYPGDAYVDVVGRDSYSEGTNPSDHPALWSTQTVKNLEKVRIIADAHNKPMGISEFGTCYRIDGIGAGDDDYFMTQMAQYANSHNVAYMAYFNAADTTMPNGTLAQKQLNRSQNNVLAEPSPNTSFVGPYVTADGTQPGSNYFVNAATVWRGPLWAEGAVGMGVIPVTPPPTTATTLITARHDRNQALLSG